VKTVGEKRYSFVILPLGKTWCPMRKRLGGFQELVWRAGLYPWAVQPIAIPYTDRANQTAVLASTKTLFSQPEGGYSTFF
jgi:hypothetical protein